MHSLILDSHSLTVKSTKSTRPSFDMTGWSSLPFEVAALIFRYFALEISDTYQDMIEDILEEDFLERKPSSKFATRPLRDYFAIILVSRSFHHFITSELEFRRNHFSSVPQLRTLPEILLRLQYIGICRYSRGLSSPDVVRLGFSELVTVFGRFWKNSRVLDQKDILLDMLAPLCHSFLEKKLIRDRYFER
jgi:hypothetical protein